MWYDKELPDINMNNFLLFIYYIHSIIIADSLWTRLAMASLISSTLSSTTTTQPTKYLICTIPNKMLIIKTCKKLLEVRKRVDRRDLKQTRQKRQGRKKTNKKS